MIGEREAPGQSLGGGRQGSWPQQKIFASSKIRSIWQGWYPAPHYWPVHPTKNHNSRETGSFLRRTLTEAGGTGPIFLPSLVFPPHSPTKHNNTPQRRQDAAATDRSGACSATDSPRSHRRRPDSPQLGSARPGASRRRRAGGPSPVLALPHSIHLRRLASGHPVERQGQEGAPVEGRRSVPVLPPEPHVV